MEKIKEFVIKSLEKTMNNLENNTLTIEDKKTIKTLLEETIKSVKVKQ